MILNSAGLPSTTDKEMLWTSQKKEGRGFLRLRDLQIVGFVNYYIMNVLNVESISKKVLMIRIEDVRKF